MKQELVSFSMFSKPFSFSYGNCFSLARFPSSRRPQEIPLLSHHIPELASFLLQCGANRTYEAELRVLALNALNWTVQ